MTLKMINNFARKNNFQLFQQIFFKTFRVVFFNFFLKLNMERFFGNIVEKHSLTTLQRKKCSHILKVKNIKKSFFSRR